jgi:hypothetical protein
MESWLTNEAAVALIGDWAGIPKGAALPKLDEAIASGTIRGRGTPEANATFLIESGIIHPYELAADGSWRRPPAKPDEIAAAVKDMENYERLLNVNFVSSVRLGHILISEDDLQYWLERHLPRQTSAVKKYVRYADDAALIAKGIKGVQGGKWPNAKPTLPPTAAPSMSGQLIKGAKNEKGASCVRTKSRSRSHHTDRV